MYFGAGWDVSTSPPSSLPGGPCVLMADTTDSSTIPIHFPQMRRKPCASMPCTTCRRYCWARMSSLLLPTFPGRKLWILELALVRTLIAFKADGQGNGPLRLQMNSLVPKYEASISLLFNQPMCRPIAHFMSAMSPWTLTKRCSRLGAWIWST